MAPPRRDARVAVLMCTRRELFEADATFESSQRRAETEVQAVAETDGNVVGPFDVESICACVLAFVAVRRAVEQEHA